MANSPSRTSAAISCMATLTTSGAFGASGSPVTLVGTVFF
jgi:hypothetical protein